jgi:transcriptional regulator with PAS, ATPase and Fis domain
VLNIHIPPLRERSEDVPLLVKEFVRIVSRKYNKQNLIEIPVNCLQKLVGYSWPGNVRQLENFIEGLLILSDSEFSLQVFDELYYQLIEYPKMHEIVSERSPLSLKKYLHMKNQENETKMIWEAMKDSRFCRTEAAKKLGISRTTLWRKVKESGSCPDET